MRNLSPFEQQEVYMTALKKTAPPGAMELYHTLIINKDKIIQARQAMRMNANQSSKSLESIKADLSALETKMVLLETDMLLWQLEYQRT